MNGTRLLTAIAAPLVVAVAAAGCCADTTTPAPREKRVRVDSVPENEKADRYSRLTDADFRMVAEELGVEVAAIKAVVLIEAGRAMQGFWAPGVPVVNFDRTMYNQYRSKAKDKSGDKSAKVPSGLSGYALKEWTALTNARRVNRQGADMGTFWGMFQIGGFNYRLCGCESIGEFVTLMSSSELEQLELFAALIQNAGLLNDLRAKNWSGFARRYNGPSYARRGYHTRMANAYAKFRKENTGQPKADAEPKKESKQEPNRK